MNVGGGGFSGSSSRSRSGSEKIRRLVNRLIRPSRWPTMDFEQAAWQLTYLCISPRRVYRNVYYHKQTKNTWARDDPAILIIVIGSIGVVSLLWMTFYLRLYSPLDWIGLSLKMIFRDFLMSGIIVSSLLWAISNKFLTQSNHNYATDQRVEWQYSFDIHVNSFLPFFLNLYVLQLILVPVITRDNWLSLWIGNSLYLIAVIQYAYITYLGYNALPFLIRSESLLLPILPFLILYVISLLGFNISKNFLDIYF
ncbi:UNC-50 [Phakopsora pachyrhizi]|nr:UNC-50 [Phakopsora pachyrhizi]